MAGNIKFSIVGTDRFKIFVSVARVNKGMLKLCGGGIFTLDREVIITSKIRTVIQVVRRGYPLFLSVMPKHETRSDSGSLWLLLMLNNLFYTINPLNPQLNPICYLLALLGAHHFLHVSRIGIKLLTFRLLMSYIYGASILDVSRSHTTTQHSR